MVAIETNRGRPALWILAFAAVGLPAFVLRFAGGELDPVLAALVYGLGIVGGAFLISWAAEAAQLDVPTSFAIAILALIAILPEYSIEAVLAWKAGATFNPALPELVTPEMELVAANVNGSEPPSHRGRVVPRDTHLRYQTAPSIGHPWPHPPRDGHAGHSDPGLVRNLHNAAGPHRAGCVLDSSFRLLPVEEL